MKAKDFEQQFDDGADLAPALDLSKANVHFELESAGQCMRVKTSKAGSSKIKYTNEALGDMKVVKDFLPSPAELSFNEEAVNVTWALSKKSIISLSRKQLKTTHNTSA